MCKRQINYSFQQTPISKAVCDAMQMTHLTVLSKAKNREIATARQLIRYFLVATGEVPFHMEKDGYGSHATIIQSVKNIENWYATDRRFRMFFLEIKEIVERKTGQRLRIPNTPIKYKAIA